MAEEKNEKGPDEPENQTSDFHGNENVIFDICQKEYENEKARTNTIDFKISIVIAVVMAAIAIALQIIDFGNLAGMTFLDAKSLLSFAFKLVVGVLSFLSLLASLLILLIAVITRTYYSTNCRNYLEVEQLENVKPEYYLICATNYADCSEANKEVNDRRCKLYNASILLVLIGAVLLTVFIVLKALM